MVSLPTSPGQVDLHLHAGQERDQPLDDLVGSFVAHGIDFLGLLDHSELYEMGDQALKAKFGQIVYHSTHRGLLDFYDDVDRMRQIHAHDAFIFKGMELPEWDILFVDQDSLKPADFLGCHMNTSCHDPTYRHYVKTSCGEHLATRANQLLSVCKSLGKPALLFHPFHRRVQELRARMESDDDIGSEEVFSQEDVDIFLDRVEVGDLFVELNFGDIYSAASQPEILKKLGRTCQMLKKGGIGFSLGSDYHRTPKEFRDPTNIVRELGLRLEDLGLIYELAGIGRG